MQRQSCWELLELLGLLGLLELPVLSCQRAGAVPGGKAGRQLRAKTLAQLLKLELMLGRMVAPGGSWV